MVETNQLSGELFQRLEPLPLVALINTLRVDSLYLLTIGLPTPSQILLSVDYTTTSLVQCTERDKKMEKKKVTGKRK